MAVHRCDSRFVVHNVVGQHYLQVDAEWGTSQQSAFFNMQDKLVSLNNNNNIGYLGVGSQLKGKTVVVKTNAENNTPNLYHQVDRILVRYLINDQVQIQEICIYDKNEDEDDYPTIKLTIYFV